MAAAIPLPLGVRREKLGEEQWASKMVFPKKPKKTEKQIEGKLRKVPRAARNRQPLPNLPNVTGSNRQMWHGIARATLY